MNTKIHILLWACRLTAAGIMLQTLFFKFSAHPDSVYIFTQLGVEPLGRYFAGISELLASVLILLPRFSKLGALLGLGIMSGAILSHLLVLGLEVNHDQGRLFTLALITLLASAMTFVLSKRNLLAF